MPETQTGAFRISRVLDVRNTGQDCCQRQVYKKTTDTGSNRPGTMWPCDHGHTPRVSPADSVSGCTCFLGALMCSGSRHYSSVQISFSASLLQRSYFGTSKTPTDFRINVTADTPRRLLLSVCAVNTAWHNVWCKLWIRPRGTTNLQGASLLIHPIGHGNWGSNPRHKNRICILISKM